MMTRAFAQSAFPRGAAAAAARYYYAVEVATG